MLRPFPPRQNCSPSFVPYAGLTPRTERPPVLSLSGDRGLAKASPGCGLRHEQPRDMHSGEWLAHALLRGGGGTQTLDVKDPGTADLWAQTKTRGGGDPSAASQRRSQAAPRPKGSLPHSLPHIQGIQIAVTVINDGNVWRAPSWSTLPQSPSPRHRPAVDPMLQRRKLRQRGAGGRAKPHSGEQQARGCGGLAPPCQHPSRPPSGFRLPLWEDPDASFAVRQVRATGSHAPPLSRRRERQRVLADRVLRGLNPVCLQAPRRASASVGTRDGQGGGRGEEGLPSRSGGLGRSAAQQA